MESFARAFRALGEELILVSFGDIPYAGDKKTWSLLRRLRVRVSWFVNNLKYALVTLGRARINGVDVVLFRFDPLNRFAGAVFLVSLFYPVILEVNALRSIEQYQGRPASSDFLDRLSLSKARSTFVVSTKLRDHVIEHYRVDGRKIWVIENGVDETMFSPDVSGQWVRDRFDLGGRFVIGFVGSFSAVARCASPCRRCGLNSASITVGSTTACW